MKKRGLGKGLNALLGGVEREHYSDQSSVDNTGAGAGETVVQVALDLIVRGQFQPRSHFDEQALDELAESIRRQGIVQPIVLRPLADGRYELVAGERRWRAAQRAGLSQVPALVRPLDDQQTAAIALIENIQRADLKPLEEMAALEQLQKEFGLTHQEIAEAVGRSRVAVTNLLRLRELSSEARQYLEDGRLDMGHVRALLGLPCAQQPAVAREIWQKGLTVRGAEALVRRLQEQAATPKKDKKQAPSADIKALEQNLSEHVGAAVAIHHRARGNGRLEIRYQNLDELDGLLARLGYQKSDDESD